MKNFLKVYGIDVNAFTDKKGKLTYLSWANGWKEFMKVYPDATYTVKKAENGMCAFGNKEIGYMVYTTVTVDESTHEMWLPVMDFKNKSMMNPTTFDINKAVMRCLTKNLAMFGLGLYIYAGEDIPEDTDIDRPTSTELTKEEMAEIERIEKEKLEKINEVTITAIIESLDKKHISVTDFVKEFGIAKVEDLTKGQVAEINTYFKKVKKQKEGK